MIWWSHRLLPLPGTPWSSYHRPFGRFMARRPQALLQWCCIILGLWMDDSRHIVLGCHQLLHQRIISFQKKKLQEQLSSWLNLTAVQHFKCPGCQAKLRYRSRCFSWCRNTTQMTGYSENLWCALDNNPLDNNQVLTYLLGSKGSCLLGQARKWSLLRT